MIYIMGKANIVFCARNKQRRNLLHDNARQYVATMTQGRIKKFGLELVPHPPYSPDIAPFDYHLFQTIEHFLLSKQKKVAENT